MKEINTGFTNSSIINMTFLAVDYMRHPVLFAPVIVLAPEIRRHKQPKIQNPATHYYIGS